jgi:hypothetical protein
VYEARGRLALARGDATAAQVEWQEALKLYADQDRQHDVRDLRCELAVLHVEPAAPAAPAAPKESLDRARSEIDAVLAAAGAEEAEAYVALGPQALCACLIVFEACGDARAGGLLGHLRQRLAQQLAQVPDEPARQRLLQQVPHWAALRARLQAQAGASGRAP